MRYLLVIMLLASPLMATTLTVTATHGTVVATPNLEDYATDDEVMLVPIPDVGYCFTGWSGAVTGTRLVQRLTMNTNKAVTATFDTWTAPIGITPPDFGVLDTYRMYDDSENRIGSLTYSESPGDGYFTHYVDNTSPNASDHITNPAVTNYLEVSNKGTVARPRNTIPLNIPEGSVVEVHGGPYAYGSLSGGYHQVWIRGVGSFTYPIFVRGVGTPIWDDMNLQVGGVYLVIEGFHMDNSFFNFHSDYATRDHIVIRGHEIHGYTGSSGTMVNTGATSTDIVVYANHIYKNGNVPTGEDKDVHGVIVGSYTDGAWVLDNYIHQNDGDSVQMNACGGLCCTNNEWPRNIYIGRNVMHGDRENAVDLKDTNDVIVSQNEMFGYTIEDRVFGSVEEARPVHSSDGTAFILANEGGRKTWSLFNRLYDSAAGCRISDQCVIPTSYIIGNEIYNCTNGIITWRVATVYILNNTMYGNAKGFFSQIAHGDPGPTYDSTYYIVNNIIVDIIDHPTVSEDEVHIRIRESLAADRSTLSYCLFSQDVNNVKIEWPTIYTSVAAFVAGEPGKGEGCLETDPLFVSATNHQLQANSPAVNSGIYTGPVATAYDLFQTLYGINIKKDINGITRPQGSAWDMGAYERNQAKKMLILKLN